MRKVFEQIERIGPTDIKVMILGPTGAGKDASCLTLALLTPTYAAKANAGTINSRSSPITSLVTSAPVVFDL